MGVNLNLDLTQQPKVVLQVKMMGVYAAGTDYAVGDAVTYNGGTYYMHTDAAAGTAPTETANWQAINSPNDYVESLTSFTLTNATTDNTISIDQNGDVGTNVATDGAIHIENTGNTGIGLGVYTNIGATGAAALVSIKADNAAFTQDVVSITGDGTGNTLSVTMNNAPASNKRGIFLSVAGDLANNGNGMLIYSNTEHSGTNALAKVWNDNASAVNRVFEINSDGSGAALVIDSAVGTHINFIGDPANASSADGDLWFDGTNFKVNIATVVYNIAVTAA